MTRLTGEALLDALEAGEVRVAEPTGAGAHGPGAWRVNAWVREELLALFRTSPLVAPGAPEVRELWPFVDKQAFPVRTFGTEDGVRLVPGGSSVRRGAFVGRGVVLMPPSYVNVGAWVGAGAMVDSHALVGSAAQVGERVHVAAGAQLGGVLEPAGARPVIVEDQAWIGAHCGLFEGVFVGRRAVLGAGVVLTGSTPLYDLVHGEEIARDAQGTLAIPESAVVVPGTRPARGEYARERGLALACGLIVKYRDASTEAAVALEDALR